MVQRKNKDTNKWEFDVSNGVDPITKKRIRKVITGFATKKEARKAEEEFIALNFNKGISSKNVTLDIIYLIMTKIDVEKEKKESYIKTQEYNYNKHFKEYFKEATISKLTKTDMLTFRSSLLNKGLSKSTVNKQMVLLRKLMSVAVEKHYIPTNPCHSIKKLKYKTEKMSFWTGEEFQQFISLFQEDEEPYKLIFRVAFSTGMRIGEILALTWKDIDFPDETIHVTKTLTRGNQFKTNTPKTSSSEREITIQKPLIRSLQEWKSQQQQLLAPYYDNTEDLQIFQFVPSHINYENVRRQYDNIIRRDSTLKRIRIHDFRHSHAAYLIHMEEKEIVIMERLGHSTINITYDIYGHLYPSKQKELASKMEAF